MDSILQFAYGFLGSGICALVIVMAMYIHKLHRLVERQEQEINQLNKNVITLQHTLQLYRK